MGWWQTVSGSVIGDPAADYIEAFGPMAGRWLDASDLPGEVRERLNALYVEGIGREPTDQELCDLLGFCQ